MGWIATFHVTWAEIGAGLMVLSGGWMVWDMRRLRLRRSLAAHPANRPYDWARDDASWLRQAICVHRRAS